jgi:hypothetical protein
MPPLQGGGYGFKQFLPAEPSNFFLEASIGTIPLKKHEYTSHQCRKSTSTTLLRVKNGYLKNFLRSLKCSTGETPALRAHGGYREIPKYPADRGYFPAQENVMKARPSPVRSLRACA